MEQVAELRGAERALFEQRAAALNYGRDVGALEVARERAARIEAPLEHRLDDRAHREAVARRHEVESGAHQRSPDRGAVRDELRQRGGIEVLEVEILWLDPAAMARLMAPVVSTAGGKGSDPPD